MIQPEPEGSTQGYPLVSVEVLRYDKRSKSENMGIVPTEMELILEHTQQGISHEVSVTPTKPGRMTKPYSSHRFISNYFNAGNLKMEVKNFMRPPMTSFEDINDPSEAMNAALILFAKAFHLTAPTNNNQMTLSNPRNRQIAQPGINMSQDRQIQNVGGNVQNVGVQSGGYQIGLVVVPRIANQNGTGDIIATRAEGSRNGNQAKCYNCKGLGHIARNCTARPRTRDVVYLQTQLLFAQKEEARIQLQAKEFDFMADAGDLNEIEEVNAHCILMENLQHASTSGTQLDTAPVYDTDGSAEVQLNDNCYDNETFNMFTQEEQYTDLLEPIPKP
nr:hypothetical protein [Tanacetum cinerariifolium]